MPRLPKLSKPEQITTREHAFAKLIGMLGVLLVLTLVAALVAAAAIAAPIAIAIVMLISIVAGDKAGLAWRKVRT